MLDMVDGAGSMGVCGAVVGGAACGGLGQGRPGLDGVWRKAREPGVLEVERVDPAGVGGVGFGRVGSGAGLLESCELESCELESCELEDGELEAGGVEPDGFEADGVPEGGAIGGAFGLYDVYLVLASRDAEVHGGIARRGVEIALSKVLGRIEREGQWAVRFADAEGVRRYARKVLATSRRDAARRVEVERRFVRGIGGASARLECATGGDREAAWASERAEIDEWLAARVGADDVEILAAVALDESAYPELAKEWGVREGTLRTRFHRARARFTRPWSSEFGASRGGRERAARPSKAPSAGGYGM